MTESPFSSDGYRDLVQAFLDKGYTVRHFADCRPERSDLILRHDIDISLEAAISVAETEYSLGVAATYFVLLRTDMYNPLSRQGQSVLHELRALGHDIGLHLDASLYPDNRDALQQAAAQECAALEAILGAPVRVISFHRPAPSLVGSAHELAGRLSAYSRRYTHDMGYCSDSRGGWHYGLPLEHESVRKGTALQLLTHPIWWNGAETASPTQKLLSHLENRATYLDNELAAQCGIHTPASILKAKE